MVYLTNLLFKYHDALGMPLYHNVDMVNWPHFTGKNKRKLNNALIMIREAIPKP